MLGAALLLVVALAVAMMSFDNAGLAFSSEELCRGLSELSDVRIVVIGDLHGDLDALGDVLEAAGLVDGEDRCEWKGDNSSMLVQLGDVVDRGPNSPGVTECLSRLQRSAPSPQSVARLSGNHELMWAEGDFRFVSKSETADVRERSVARWIEDVKAGRVKGALAVGPLLFTHAGFRPSMVSRVAGEEVSAAALADFVDRALLEAVEKNQYDAELFSAGPDRGGRGIGGPFWTDFSVLLHATGLPQGIVQIVGHSAARCKATRDAQCEPVRARTDLRAICVDVGLSEAYASNRAYLDIRGTSILASTLGPDSTWRHVDLAASSSLRCGQTPRQEEEEEEEA